MFNFFKDRKSDKEIKKEIGDAIELLKNASSEITLLKENEKKLKEQNQIIANELIVVRTYAKWLETSILECGGQIQGGVLSFKTGKIKKDKLH